MKKFNKKKKKKKIHN